MEKCSKHEAIVKAASLIGANPPPSAPAPTPATKLFTEADELEKEALMGKVFSYFKKSLPLTRKAGEYLQGRGIDIKAFGNDLFGIFLLQRSQLCCSSSRNADATAVECIDARDLSPKNCSKIG